MNFSSTFIKRPIATSLLMVAIALFGILAYNALPVSDLPNVDFPTLVVSASLPGANPDTMASSVATPLERQFTTIAGLDSMTSVSSIGSTQITLQFDLNRAMDGAAVDVQTAISAAMPLLPGGMPSPPSFRKNNPGDSPMMFLGLTSKTLPMSKLSEYAERMIAQRISTVPGVAQVMVMSSQKYAVHVKLDPNKLAAKKIGINEVDQAIRDWNVNMPTGALFGQHKAYNIQADGQLMDADAYRKAVVTFRNGAPVRLEDLGTIVDSVEDERTSSWAYTKDSETMGINLMVMRQPNSNTIEVVDKIRGMMPQFQAMIPPSSELFIRGDRSKNIRDAFRDIQITMALTAFLVILVIFAFLRNFSATLIPSLALPFSIVGTFAVMYLLGYSLDNLSMMALILSIGFVVDDAIVMLENIVRHIELGVPPMEAALKGSREISFTIISMTLSLAAVFIPVLFMGGILGRLFREFAVTISVAVLISGLVSVTLTPMLCSRLLRYNVDAKHGFLYNMMEKLIQFLARIYGSSLRWVLRYRPIMGVVFAGVLVATVVLFDKVPKGFIPDQDSDQLYVNTEAIQGTSYPKMNDMQRRIARIIAADPNVDTFMSGSGGSSMYGGGGSNTGRMYVSLKPRKERELGVTEIIAKLRPKLNQLPGIRAFMTAPQMIRLGGRGSKSQYEFTLQGPDAGELYKHGQILEKELTKLPALAEVSSDIQIRSPRVNVAINRDRAASLGLSAEDIEAAIYAAYGPKWVSTIYGDNNQYRVLLELEPQYQEYSDLLSLLYFKASNGQLIPMNAFSSLKEDAMPQSINHSGQAPSVTISFNLKPGIALGEAVNQVEEAAAQVLPQGITYSFSGTAKAFQSSLKNLTLLLLIAVAIVYIVLGILYESFVQPLTILSGLPSAVFGALLTLYMFNIELNIYGFVGLLMLIGIVKKNAIMQIDFALEAERKDGLSPEEAIFQGCLVRFRPIMMTTLAALLGSVPMAIGFGAGGESRRPLGMAVVGGLIFSQLITLYLTPVVYTYMDGLKTNVYKLLTRRKTKRLEPAVTTGD